MSFETSDMDLGEPTHTTRSLLDAYTLAHFQGTSVRVVSPQSSILLVIIMESWTSTSCYFSNSTGSCGLAKPTHTLVVPCWMPKPLPPRNEWTGCFTPASDMCISYISELPDVWINDIVTLISARGGNSNKQSHEARLKISQRHRLCTHNPTYTLDYVSNYLDQEFQKKSGREATKRSREESGGLGLTSQKNLDYLPVCVDYINCIQVWWRPIMDQPTRPRERPHYFQIIHVV